MGAIQETVYLGNTPIALLKDGKTYRIFADQIDTPRVITDNANIILWAWDSKPFGESQPDEDANKDGTSLSYNLRFPGQYYDQETGKYYNFNRDYDPKTGRYVQSDPIGLDGGMNSYLYSNGNPLNNTDKTGLFPTEIKALRRYIDISLDAHNSAEIARAKELIACFPHIRFTVYVYYSDVNKAAGLKTAGAAVVGLHINPVNSFPVTLPTQMEQFYGIVRYAPIAIHGHMIKPLIDKLKAANSSYIKYKTPWIRAASPNPSFSLSKPVLASFSHGFTKTQIKDIRNIKHYFGHPNNESLEGTNGYNLLVYFNGALPNTSNPDCKTK